MLGCFAAIISASVETRMEEDEFDYAIHGMLRDAPITRAWEAQLCADRQDSNDIALCLSKVVPRPRGAMS